MIIRQETEKDFENIYNLIEEAFKTAKVSDGKEQDFADSLRKGKGYIPELALIAEEDNKLIGHIMLTKTYISNNGNPFETLLLAPISVALEYRNKGVGSKLIFESFKLAKELGYTSVVLVGDPQYYTRFGFKHSINFNIKNLNNIPDEYIMAYELIPNSLTGINGTIKFETL